MKIGTMTKRFLAAAVALISLGAIAPAVAADLPAQTYTKAPIMVPVAYDWTGFYVGGNGGRGAGRRRLPQHLGRLRRWTGRLSLADEFMGVRSGSAGRLVRPERHQRQHPQP